MWDQFEDDFYQVNFNNVSGYFFYNVEIWCVVNCMEWMLNDISCLVVGFFFENQLLYYLIVVLLFFSLLIDNDQIIFGSIVCYNIVLGNYDLLVGLNYGDIRVKGGNYFYIVGFCEDLNIKVDNQVDNFEVFVMDCWYFVDCWMLVYGVQVVIGCCEVCNVDIVSGVECNLEGIYEFINLCVGLIYMFFECSELFSNVSKFYEVLMLYELEDDICGNE